MRTLLIIMTVLSLAFPTLAEPSPALKNPQLYNQKGLSFSHPGNWKVTEDSADEGIRTIFVEDEGDAIYAIQIFEKGVASADLQEFARAFSSTAAKELPNGMTVSPSKFQKITGVVNGQSLNGIGEKFAIIYLGVETPHVREYYLVKSDTHSSFLTSQVAAEDEKEANPAFALMNRTFQFQP